MYTLFKKSSITKHLIKPATLLNLITLLVLAVFICVNKRTLDNGIFDVIRNIIISFAGIMLLRYMFYMIISPWYDVFDVLEKKKNTTQKNTPLVSVIIPAWNEEVGILSTINSVLKSSYPKIQLVIINDGSTDGSHGIILRFINSYKHKRKLDNKRSISYVYKKNGGKGSALNTGISRSKGSIIITIDADCILDKNAVKNFVAHFENPTTMAAVGNVKIANTKNFVEDIQFLEFLFSFYFKKADSLLNSIYIIGGAAGAFRKSVFESLGGYSTENITEDIELSMRIQKHGMKIKYAADSIIYTEGAHTIDGLMKQRLRWKRGRIDTFIEYRSLFFSKEKHHNKMLTFFMLPLAIFGDIQLSLEPLFISFLLIYTALTYDTAVLVAGMAVVWIMYIIQILFDDKSQRNFKTLILIPSAWIMFYITTAVEVYALVKAVNKRIKKQDIVWQSWDRKGIAVQR